MTKTAATPETLALRRLLDGRRDEFRTLLSKYAATNPQLFGSVARGTAQEGSDIDIFPAQLLKRPISAQTYLPPLAQALRQHDIGDSPTPRT